MKFVSLFFIIALIFLMAFGFAYQFFNKKFRPNDLKRLLPGQGYYQASDSPTNHYSTAFEDDQKTGYFYAVLRENKDIKEILDAMYIYSADDVVDKDKPSEVKIVWSKDGLKSMLLINDYPHAVFNFEDKRGYCRTNFPFPNKEWSNYDTHVWSEDALDFFE